MDGTATSGQAFPWNAGHKDPFGSTSFGISPTFAAGQLRGRIAVVRPHWVRTIDARHPSARPLASLSIAISESRRDRTRSRKQAPFRSRHTDDIVV